jgi:iron(III) transport system substrate-binding protein
MNVSKRVGMVAGLAALSLGLSACGGSGSSSSSSSGAGKLTVYNAQHDDLMKAVLDGFTKTTGIQVQMRDGSDSELANQIVQEGKASPADVFVTENSPAMTLVDSKSLFAKLDQGTLDQVPDQYEPASGTWTGFAARSTVLAYNSKQLKATQLPASILDLAKPEWKGKVAFSPSGADFQAIVSAVVTTAGEQKAAEWLAGLKRNGKVYQGNSTVMKAVNAGEVATGIIYHYYWYKDRAESGANSKDVVLHHFTPGDAGNFVSVSGAGVLASSANKAQAQRLVKYMTSKAGQEALSGSTALEYSIASDVPANPVLPPLSSLGAPAVQLGSLNGPKVVALMQRAGLL